MVLIDGIKYACQSCVKGHRSSKCTHTSRELIEIKKKGRPNSQCSHCRELRKTRSVHGKCECAARLSEGPPKAKVLPRGLADLPKQDFSPVGGSAPSMVKVSQLLNPCNCQRGGSCQCCKVVSRAGKKTSPAATPELSVSGSSPESSHSDAPIINNVQTNMDWSIQGVADWTALNSGTGFVHPPASAPGGCCSGKAAAAAAAATPAPAEPFAQSTPSTSAFTLDLPAHSNFQPIRPKPAGGCCKSRVKSPPIPASTPNGASTPSATGAPGQGGSYFTGPIRSASVLPSHHNSPYASPALDLTPACDSPSAIYMPSFFPATPNGSVPVAHTPLFVPSTHGTAACFCGELCACPGCPQHDPFKKKVRGGGNSCHCGPTSEALTRTGQAGVLRPCCGGDLVLPEGVSSLEDILKDVAANAEGESLAGMWDPNEAGAEGVARPPLPPLKEIWPDSLDLADQAMQALQSMASPEGFDELTTSLLIAAGGGRAEQVNLAYSAFADSRIGTGGGTPPPNQPPVSLGMSIQPESIPTSIATPMPTPMPQLFMEQPGCEGMYSGEVFHGGCGVACQCTTDCSCPVGTPKMEFPTGLVA